ncbi:transcriptional regulator, ArsR family [Rhizobium sp. CF080]|uniref:sulfite-sensing transcriptional repressor BigR n=1 Tax=Rhizobium sp. (strain CF080) TaxID=1144310 RepID=UPI000271D5B9|nr:sulfite-sensing transcriptional repressor BigR [Rhizobium sp. CF080]EUB99329.1 transcriptional regulator, ArsR family [Rhizobium sp. CF080]
MVMTAGIREAAKESMTSQDMTARAAEVSSLLKTLAHPGRLMLVCTLVDGEFSVSALEAKTDIHQPHLSQHLTWLREARIVATRREGKQIFYSLTEEKAAQLVNALHRIFCKGDGQ